MSTANRAAPRAPELNRLSPFVVQVAVRSGRVPVFYDDRNLTSRSLPGEPPATGRVQIGMTSEGAGNVHYHDADPWAF